MQLFYFASLVANLSSLCVLGASGTIEHWRDGQKINTLFDESVYDYENPIFNE